MADIRIENVWKKFDNTVAVRDVSLEIEDGRFVVLLGPSGCGKTTLLRMLAGLEAVSDGSLRIGDRDVTNLPARERDIAMVFQSYALYPHMTVRRNLGFALELKKLPASEINQRIDSVSEILGITELLERRPKQLSGGQRQRVAVGRAIVREPSAFLFDEPLSNLDAKLRASMRGELVKLHRRLRATIVYVTHDQVEAMTMGELVVVMRDGVIQQQGSPLEIYDDPDNRFVAEFIGSPSMNLFEGHFNADGRTITTGNESGVTLTPPQPVADMLCARGSGPYLFGIRPEHLAIVDGTAPAGSVGATMFNGRLENVELLGAETIAEFSFPGASLLARLPGSVQPDVGETLPFRLTNDRLYVFDNETGARLRP